MTQPEIALTDPIGPAGAPLLVLGHSLGTGPLIWEPALHALQAEYRVTLVSLPGHGAAPVPTQPFTMSELGDAVAERVLDLAGGPGGALYAGVSIGGALALTLALEHPEVFRAVASLASAASLGDREHWSARAALVRAQSTSVLVAPSSKSWFAPDSIANEPDMTGRILRVLQNTSDEGYARCAEALAGYDLRARLGEIRIPVLALGGEFDTVAPADRQDEIVAGVRDGRSGIIAGAAHQPPAEQGAATAAALLEFFARSGR